ncbi:MAG: sigma-70 family RNA polymerase sigma factor [Verrucomicrobia bacterium]|nr:sigma-70 family RNA polymerase sigma factor [Verrucomicrobiota bacterium]
MSCESCRGANLQQEVMILPSVPVKSTSDASVRTERVSALYEIHRDRIYGFLIRKGLNATIAQELTQDVFVDLFLALEKGTPIESEQRWLYAVAGRTALDHWRHQRYRMRVEFDSDSSAAADVPSSEPTPEAQAEHKQQLSRVAAGLRNLSKEQRLCIQLRAQGLRYREIAGVLRVSTSTAAEWVNCAADRLREQADTKSPAPRTLAPGFGR